MARRDRRNTVSGRAVATLGPRGALTLLTFVQLWSLYRATHDGNDPTTVEELANELGRTSRSIFSWLADFRAVFGDDFDNPGELLDALGVTTAITVKKLRDENVPKPQSRP